MDYRTQVFPEFSAVPPEHWQAIWSGSGEGGPFNRIEFLLAMETSGSATAETGWQARPMLIYRNDQPVAAIPLYLKSHSYGEYVFDWAWARAFEQAGRPYYPKALVAMPFSPVPGQRLLAIDAQARAAAAAALSQVLEQSGLSSGHLLFGTEADHTLLEEQGWLRRSGVQFHWINKGYSSFEDFLEHLTQPKRKKIRAERRKVREAGIQTEIRVGRDIGDDLWDFFYRCYCQTYLEHGNPPYLTRAFFEALAASLPEAFVMAIARRADQTPIAAALLMRDQTNQVLYGRYWGGLEHIPCLHFELAYYTPLEWAIASGISRFEGGAQGEHKMARGFEPVQTHSMHWISEPRFKDAVARFLERETDGVDAYLSELDDRRPFTTRLTQLPDNA